MRLIPLLIGVALAAPSLAAETRAEEAKRHFARSKELYEDGDFVASLNELERAYAAVPNFKLLYNIGQIQAQLQNYAAALKSFRQFLADGGSEVSEARRAEVLREIEKFRIRVAELTISSVDGAEIAIDDVVVGKAPLSGPVRINVGRRKLTATLADHFPVTKYVEVAGLDQLNVKLDLQPVVTASRSAATRPPLAVVKDEPSARLPAWVPWVGTAALGAGTAVVGVLAFQSSAEQKKLLGTYGITRNQLDAVSSRTRTEALITDILAGCTAAAAIGSLLFTLLRAPDAPAPTVSVGLSSNAVFVVGSF